MLHQLVAFNFNFKMMFITALVSLLLTAVITEGQVCSRVVDESVYGLESDSASVRLGYAAVSSRVQTAMKSQGGIAAKSQSQRCAVSTTASVSSSLSHPWGRTCEACPPRVYYLRRFLRYCYVAQWPFKQQIRYVRCPSPRVRHNKAGIGIGGCRHIYTSSCSYSHLVVSNSWVPGRKVRVIRGSRPQETVKLYLEFGYLGLSKCPMYRCNQPCWCSNSRCVATRHSLVWVWAYCTRSTSLGFVRGINYRWLWLPQDCQCRES